MIHYLEEIMNHFKKQGEDKKWENDDVYQTIATTKELRKIRDKIHDKKMYATSKKFIVSRFNNYKIVDGRSIMEQFYELERILNHFTQHNMHMISLL